MHNAKKRKEADVAAQAPAGVATDSGTGKRRLGGRGVPLLAVGLYLNKEGEAQPVGDAAALWEGLVVNVPAIVFQEDDPEGYYAGNVRPALTPRALRCLPSLGDRACTG